MWYLLDGGCEKPVLVIQAVGAGFGKIVLVDRKKR